MNRRDFVRVGIGSGAAALAATQSVTAMAADSAHLRVVEADVTQLQAAMQAGSLSAVSLTNLYLARIAAVDRAGPRLNAVIELNPEALAIARELDRERKTKGSRGPLHGIPVLLKDNIATADRMRNSAGSLALADSRPSKDAHLVRQLRAAGAVILGKTNLSEWANLRSTRSTSGWSARGGLTRNPYALDRNTSGSSSGSGAAIAASLAAVAVGTETDGSIVSPASINGLVGIKPTVGLVSRSGIIPLSHTQDTAGPMARTVTDAVLLLNAMTGIDKSDTATADSEGRPRDYSKFLEKSGLRGARIGVARSFFGTNDQLDAVMEKALAVLQAEGAILIDPVVIPNTDKYGDSELEVLLYEFKAGLAGYLAAYAPDAPVKNMADVIAFNLANKDRELAHFGQEFLIRAQAKGGLDSAEYLTALANNRRYSRAEGIDLVLREHKLDALVAPTGGPAWLTDFINGDHYSGSFSSPAAVAGYPHITVPAGQLHGLPVGLSFVAGAWSEPTLIRLAYGFEQASRHRRAPGFAASLKARVK